MKFPVNSLLAGNFGAFRDGFARDSLLQRGVHCEPDFLDQGCIERVRKRLDLLELQLEELDASATEDAVAAAQNGSGVTLLWPRDEKQSSHPQGP